MTSVDNRFETLENLRHSKPVAPTENFLGGDDMSPPEDLSMLIRLLAFQNRQSSQAPLAEPPIATTEV